MGASVSTILFTCPQCGSEMQHVVSNGDCKDYRPEEGDKIPLWMLEYIDGEYATCLNHRCDHSSRVRVIASVIV